MAATGHAVEPDAPKLSSCLVSAGITGRRHDISEIETHGISAGVHLNLIELITGKGRTWTLVLD